MEAHRKYAGLVSSGSMPDFQSEGVGSIPTTRTNMQGNVALRNAPVVYTGLSWFDTNPLHHSVP